MASSKTVGILPTPEQPPAFISIEDGKKLGMVPYNKSILNYDFYTPKNVFLIQNMDKYTFNDVYYTYTLFSQPPIKTESMSDEAYKMEFIQGYKKFVGQVMFSILAESALMIASNITHTLNKSCKTVITGGMALRYYVPNHFTDDIDIKIFPNDDTIKLEEVMKNITDSTKPIVDILNNEITALVDAYITQILQPVDTYITYHNSFGHHYIKKFIGDYNTLYPIQYVNLNPTITRNPFDIKLSIAKHNPNMMKMIITFNNGMRTLIPYKPDIISKIMDIEFIDSTNTKIYDIISETNKKLNGEASKIIPTIKAIDYNKLNNFIIPTYEYLQTEKELLLADINSDTPVINPETKYNPSTKKFLTDKFNKSMRSFNQMSKMKSKGQTKKQIRPVYLGGKKRKYTRRRSFGKK